MHLDRRPPGVEGAAHRRGGEPVDRRAAARLDVGEQLQPLGERRLQRSRGDGGQVGLQQHVVDRCRHQRVERRDTRGGLVAAHQRAGVRRQPAEPADPERLGLVEGPRDLVGAGAGPARAQPGDPGHQGGQTGAGGEHLAGRQCGQLAQAELAGLDLVHARRARGPGRSTSCRRGRGCRRARAAGCCPTRRGPAPTSARRASGCSTGRARRSAARRPRPRRRGRWPAGRRPTRSRRAAPSSARRRAAAPRRPAGRARRARRCAAPWAGGCPSGRAAAPRGVRPRRRRRRRPCRPSPRSARPWAGRARRRRGRWWCGRRAAPARPRRAAPPTPPPRGTSSRRASSSSAGVAASSGETVWREVPVVASPPWSSTCSSSVRGRRRQLGEAPGHHVGRHRLGRAGAQPADPGTRPAGQALGDAAQGPRPGGGVPHQRQVGEVLERGGASAAGSACTIETSSARVV